MVKGITRRVIVVKPENKLFDEAIFIVKDDMSADRGVSKNDVVAEAARAASELNRSGYRTRSAFNHRAAIFFCGLGAIAASLIWVILIMLL